MQIFKLTSEVEQVQSSQGELDRALEAIAVEHENVHRTLSELEQQVAQKALTEPTSAADVERDKSYTMAFALFNQLEQIGGALESIVAQLNEQQQPLVDDSPMANIVTILNNHDNLLTYIDNQVSMR